MDNKFAIALAKNLVFNDQSKHIDTRYHYIRECITTDIFIKPLKQEDFTKLRSLIGVTKSSFFFFFLGREGGGGGQQMGVVIEA